VIGAAVSTHANDGANDSSIHDDEIALTPRPPYVAVIFTSKMSIHDDEYDLMSKEMETFARSQDGFLGIESARESLGITVSYWSDEGAARAWKRVAEHLGAQRLGRARWYQEYRVRIATVIRDYGMEQ
jgi:heme-degrading monooxygenase HmoA